MLQNILLIVTFYVQRFIYSSALQDLCVGLLVLFLPVGYAMLMRPNKAETAGHGCHCPDDMAVRMPDRGLMFEHVTCLNCLKGVTFIVDCVMCANLKKS